MAEIALTEAERRFFTALEELGVRYLIVGLGAAVLQGADTVTADIDLWLEDRSDPRIDTAARRAGGVWIPGHFGMAPPMLGGEKLGDRLDVVLTLSGLDDFETEYARAQTIEVDGVPMRLLPLERIIHSKRSANRPKDRAVLPALEAALAVQRAR
ncbi:MAG TPA: hypothetical protein VGP93_21205 [Polyangiaceae bacterium]|nr:hypothetical protein [Polyangiaceae bacterium]